MITHDEFEELVFDETRKIYQKLQTANGDIKNVKRLAIFSYLIGDLTGKRILDIGCGAKTDRIGLMGYSDAFEPKFCRLAKRVGINVVGIDARIEPEDYEFEAVNASIHEIPSFPPESFDGVLISALWNDPYEFTENGSHLKKSQKEIYARMRELLRPGGYSVNMGNELSRVPEPEKFIEWGFEVMHYYAEEIGMEEIVVLRKPLVIAEGLKLAKIDSELLRQK